MEYSRKLLIAKIMITLATVLYSFVPLFIDLGDSHMGSQAWSPHARFHMGWMLSANVIAFPVLLYVLWGKLHGTGRSVRLVAFLGMAYMLGFFISSALSSKFGGALHDDGHEHLVFGIDGNLVINTLIFALLTVGVLFSIKRGNNAK